MYKYLSILVFFTCFGGFAQKVSITGNVFYTVAKMPLVNAVVMAFRFKDSFF